MASRRPTGDIEQFKRLVEIQTQIVEVAKQNEIKQRECEALRQELAQTARRPGRPRLAAAFRDLWHALVGRGSHVP